MMFATPGLDPTSSTNRPPATQIAKRWWVLLLNGLALIVAGVLVFSIDWDRALARTFIGAMFIFEGVSRALVSGSTACSPRQRDLRLLSIATGVAIIVWPGPGIVAVAIFLGAW
jgi:uncharacterized membrane protein HdeD (DUF308 family)